MTTLLLLLALGFLQCINIIEAETATNTTITMPVSGECAITYSQGEIEVCIPELTSLNTSFGYVSVSWKDPSTMEFTIGAPGANGTITIQIELYDENMTSLYSGSIVINQGEVNTFEYKVPENTRAIVYKLKLGSEEYMGAVLVPSPLVIPIPEEYGSNALILLLIGLMPVSLVLSFFLTTDPRDAAVLAFASISSIYILLTFIAPPTSIPWITMLLALMFLFTIVYYVISR